MNEPLLTDAEIASFAREVGIDPAIADPRGDSGQMLILFARTIARAALSQQPTLAPQLRVFQDETGKSGIAVFHPTERSASKPEAAIEDRASLLRELRFESDPLPDHLEPDHDK